MRRLIYFALFLTLVGCNSKPRESEIIARINGEAVTVHDYFNLYENLKPRELSLGGREKAEMKNLVLKILVRRTAILTEAKKRGVNLTDAEIQEGIKKYKSGYSASDFEQSLYEQMLNEEEWRRQLEQSLLIEKIFDSTEPQAEAVTLKDALQFYEKNAPQFRKPAEATALQIVVADRHIADDLEKKLKADPSQFLSLSKQYSIGPEAQTDSKIRIQKDVMPENLDSALFEGKLNQIQGPFQTEYGYHFVKVLNRTVAINLDFEQVKTDIFSRLAQENRKAWLLRFEERLLRSSQIEYDRNLIKRL